MKTPRLELAMSRLLAVLSSCLCWVALAAPLDGGAPLPAGWAFASKHPEHYAVEVVDVGACRAPSAVVRSAVATPSGTASVMQVFRADRYRNTRVRFTAVVTTSEVSGWAGLWMRVDGTQKKTLAFDNMQARPLRGTTPCGRQSVVLDVANDAQVIALGLVLDGPGRAELSGLSLEVVDATVATTSLERAEGDPRLDDAIGRVDDVWFSDRIINRQGNPAQLKLVSPGKWSDGSGDFTASTDAERVRATAMDYSSGTALNASGEFQLKREGEVTIIEGSWGTTVKKYPVTIRFSRKAVDMQWGFYERHLVAEKSPQVAPGCVYFAQWASVSRLSDELQVCGVMFDPRPPQVQTVLAFVLSGFRRFGTGIPLDEPPVAPVTDRDVQRAPRR